MDKLDDKSGGAMKYTKGWGLWRQDWWSFSSDPEEQSPDNGFGYWKYRWVHIIDNLIYRNFTQTWSWWHNREGSSTRKLLKKHFSGLR